MSGPVTGGVRGYAWNAWPWPLSSRGYSEHEYFLSGTAKAYGTSKPTASYTLRLQVMRPIRAKRFDGTVFVEWNNVTTQAEIDPDWYWSHPQVMRNGSAYVLASVQQTGQCGVSVPDVLPEQNGHAPVVGACNPVGLKGWDPVRYAPLKHPGDDYAYDMFSQVLDSMRHVHGVQTLSGLRVRRVVAIGESQSAQLLDVWLCNGAARGADGVLIDADFGRAAQCAPRVPVLQLLSEESTVPVRSTVRSRWRVWMLPGAPHADAWEAAFNEALLGHNETGVVSQPYEQLAATAGDFGQEGPPGAATHAVCGDEYPRRYAVDAALAGLLSWIQGGPAPVRASSVAFTGIARVRTSPAGEFTSSASLRHDADGNTVGGWRSPVLDVPVASYAGPTCALAGSSTPLSQSRLAQLYPTHGAYVRLLHVAVERAVREGRLMPVDAVDLLARGCASSIGGTDRVRCPSVTARSPYSGRTVGSGRAGTAASALRPVTQATRPGGSGQLAGTGLPAGLAAVAVACLLFAVGFRRELGDLLAPGDDVQGQR